MNRVILIVLDGFGIAPPSQGNSIFLANPKNINSFRNSYPHTLLKASGEAVGLPAGEVGNTEVGHINLGAGRIVFEDLPRINMAIADGSFYKNPAFLKTINHLKKTKGSLHLLGLVGQGTVHSSIDHLYSLLNFAKENNLKNVFIHIITDGRDSPPKSSLEIIKRLEEKLKQYSVGKIATISGRYYAMDRDLRWQRTERAYLCLTTGKGLKASSAEEAIKQAYKQGKTDEFIDPTNIIQDNQPIGLISSGDAVVFFNYRIDRPRQLTKAFVLNDFEKEAKKPMAFDPYATKYYKTHLLKRETESELFKRGEKIENLLFVTMTEYEQNLPVKVAFPKIVVKMPLGRVLSENQVLQLRISESEKERFVTYYFNGQRENPFPNENRIIIPSPKVATYDLKPEMSANKLTDVLIKKIRTENFGFILVNFANPDMVGHTGNIEACIKAIKTVDKCLGKIVNTAFNHDYAILITGDHGNAEQKIDSKTGGISTEHTNNMVPLIVIKKELQGKTQQLQSGILADVAPTILSLMKIQKPIEMTGRDLLKEIR